MLISVFGLFPYLFQRVLYLAVADGDHKEKKWYQKILDHDDDDHKSKHRERK